MNISLPAPLKSFVDDQVATGQYGTCSEYVRDLIRRDQSRRHLRDLLLAGAATPVSTVADDAYFDALVSRVESEEAP